MYNCYVSFVSAVAGLGFGRGHGWMPEVSCNFICQIRMSQRIGSASQVKCVFIQKECWMLQEKFEFGRTPENARQIGRGRVIAMGLHV